jgi:hypothetical protein
VVGSVAGRDGAAVEGAFFDQLPAKDTFHRSTAEDAGCLNGLIVRARDVLDKSGGGRDGPGRGFCPACLCFRAVGQTLVKALPRAGRCRGRRSRGSRSRGRRRRRRHGSSRCRCGGGGWPRCSSRRSHVSGRRHGELSSTCRRWSGGSAALACLFTRGRGSCCQAPLGIHGGGRTGNRYRRGNLRSGGFVVVGRRGGRSFRFRDAGSCRFPNVAFLADYPDTRRLFHRAGPGIVRCIPSGCGRRRHCSGARRGIRVWPGSGLAGRHGSYG